MEVIKVERRGGTAVHYTTQPIIEGKKVTIELDWERRFDHMQHHSGTFILSFRLSSIVFSLILFNTDRKFMFNWHLHRFFK